MKKKALILCILLIGILNIQAESKKTTEAKLNDAVVFFKGAELTHTASYKLLKGENELYIEGLSPRIDRNSLKIKASNKVLVTSYEFSVDYVTEKTQNDVIQKIKDSIDFYEKKLIQVDIDLGVTNNLGSLLQKGVEKNVSGSEEGLGIDELIKTMDYFKTKTTDLRSMKVKLEKEKEQLTATISRLNKQMEQEALKNNKESGILKLNLSSPAAVECVFTISYFTPIAGWEPFYDINITSTDAPVNIVMKSKVFQTTGLDWEKVKLTLSTAVPSNGKVAPLFNTWFLDYYKPTPQPRSADLMMQNSYSYEKSVPEALEGKATGIRVRGSSTTSSSAQPLYIVDGMPVDDISSIDPAMIKEMNVLKDASATSIYGSRAASGVVLITLKDNLTIEDYVIKDENDLNATYNIDLPYTIPGNGKQQLITLLTKETDAEYKYYCAPKLDAATYLLAEIANWEKLDLLTGKANVTYDGTYVGETYINAASTNDKLSLTLGTDKRVSVKRELMQDYSSTKFIGSDVRQEFTYKLTVRNNQNKPVKMVLKDQYPVSSQKEIVVELLTKNITPYTANKPEVGVITWEEELKAGETKEYTISYSVKYPKGRKLNL